MIRKVIAPLPGNDRPDQTLLTFSNLNRFKEVDSSTGTDSASQLAESSCHQKSKKVGEGRARQQGSA